MKVGDCFVEHRTNHGFDDQFVLLHIIKIKKLCVVEELIIGAEQPTCYEYFDLLTRRRSPNKLSALKKFPNEKFQQILVTIMNLYKESQQIVDAGSKPVNDHKTDTGDFYCQKGRVESVLGYVYFFRPSWNVDFISFSEKSFSLGHYKFGVAADKYNSNPNNWLITEGPVYDSIKAKYLNFIETLRNDIVSII